jgi:hypothetical protein
MAADLIGVRQRQALLQGRDQVDYVATGGFCGGAWHFWPLALSSISFFTSSV